MYGGDVTEFSDRDLTVDTTYTYQLQSINLDAPEGQRWSSVSAEVSVTIGADTPFTLKYENGVLSWTAVPGATNYNVIKVEGGYQATVSSTSWFPASSGQYYIQAVTGDDWSVWPVSNTIAVGN